MFYRIQENNIEEIQYYEMDETILSVGYIQLPELEDIYDELGFGETTIQQCLLESSTFQHPLSIFKSYTFGVIHMIDSKNVFSKHDKLSFYISKNFLLIVDLFDRDGSTFVSFEKSLKYARETLPSLEEFFCFFLTNFITNDNRSLELLERKIEHLEKNILSDQIESTRQEICALRRELLMLRNYYEQLMYVCEDLIADNNRLFSKEDSQQEHYKPLTMLLHRTNRLCDTTKMLQDYLSQVRESYQAQLDISLNRTMKIFTVVATIFMPLTLIVGWYGMNFSSMPELTWDYGYLYVTILSLVVVLISIYWFRKKKLF